MHEYMATVEEIIDGDTCVLCVDLGFKIFKTDKFRLTGVDTPELNSNNSKIAELALQAKKFVESKIPVGSRVKIITEVIKKTNTDKKDLYGRYLAKIYINDKCINEELIKEFYAVKYIGGKRQPKG